MKEWILFAATLAFNLSLILCVWTDAEDWYHEQQHETRLDELWGPDDEDEWAA